MSSPAVTLRPPVGHGAFSGAGLLSGATLVAGLLTYAFHVVAARSLGPDGYGRIAVLWATLFLVAVVLWRPLEQTLSRTLADRLARGEEGWSAVRSVVRIGALGCAGAGAVLALVWGPVTERLFLGDTAMTAALALGVGLYGGMFVIRGVTGGTRWFGGYALALLADSVARLVLAVGIVLYASTEVAAAAVAAAAAAGVVVPLAAGRRRLATTLAGAPSGGFSQRAALAFAGPAGVVAIGDQLIVNAGPLLVVLGGGGNAGAAAGTVFAALMLVRVPLYLFQGFAGSFLPNLTSLHVVDARRLYGALARMVALLAGAGIPIAAVAAAIGPDAMAAVYGPEYETGRLELALLGAGAGCYLAAAALAQACLALDRPGRAAWASASAVAAFVVVYAAAPGAPLGRVAVAFAASAVVQLLLLVPLVRPRAR